MGLCIHARTWNKNTPAGLTCGLYQLIVIINSLSIYVHTFVLTPIKLPGNVVSWWFGWECHWKQLLSRTMTGSWWLKYVMRGSHQGPWQDVIMLQFIKLFVRPLNNCGNSTKGNKGKLSVARDTASCVSRSNHFRWPSITDRQTDGQLNFIYNYDA